MPRRVKWRLLLLGAVFRLLREDPVEWPLYLLARLEDPGHQGLVRDHLTTHRFASLDIDGEDLKAAGATPSAAFARGLLDALAAKIDGLAPVREDQLRVALDVVRREEAPPRPRPPRQARRAASPARPREPWRLPRRRSRSRALPAPPSGSRNPRSPSGMNRDPIPRLPPRTPRSPEASKEMPVSRS